MSGSGVRAPAVAGATLATVCSSRHKRGGAHARGGPPPFLPQGTKPLVGLSFDKMKAIAYPGGDRYKLYDECEQNEFADGC